MNPFARAALYVASLGLVFGTPADAEQPAVEDQFVNTPGLGGVFVSGLKRPPKARRDPGVQGGQALRVVIPGAEPEAWRVSLGSTLVKPVSKGDVLVLAFWARAAEGPDGTSTINLPYNGIQLADEPYSPLFHEALVIERDWKLYQIRGVAQDDYVAGALMATMHLATGKQSIDFGPVFVLDLGPAKPAD